MDAPTPLDQAWLDEQLLEARREFPAQVYDAHREPRMHPLDEEDA